MDWSQRLFFVWQAKVGVSSHFLFQHLGHAYCVPLARYLSRYPLCISQIQLCPSPPPPGQLRGICLPCRSWGWGISKFCVARGSGIYLRRGRLRAFDTEVVSYPNITNHGGFTGNTSRLADWLIYQGREKLVEVFSGMYSRFYACISSLLIKTELTLRKRELSIYVYRRYFIEPNFF